MPFTIERICPSELDVGSSSDVGQKITENNWDRMFGRGPVAEGNPGYVISGLAVSSGTGLAVDITAGEAIIRGYYVNLTGSHTVSGLTASTFYRVWLKLTITSDQVQASITVTASSTTSIEDDAILLAECRAGASSVSDVFDRRAKSRSVSMGDFDDSLTSPGIGNRVVLGFRPRVVFIEESGGAVVMLADGFAATVAISGTAAGTYGGIVDEGFSVTAGNPVGDFVALA